MPESRLSTRAPRARPSPGSRGAPGLTRPRPFQHTRRQTKRFSEWTGRLLWPTRLHRAAHLPAEVPDRGRALGRPWKAPGEPLKSYPGP